jgi:hypothetical protein
MEINPGYEQIMPIAHGNYEAQGAAQLPSARASTGR